MRLIHRFLHRFYGIPGDFVLNRSPADVEPAVSPVSAADLRRVSNALKADAFDLDRGQVDYARVHHSAAFADYQVRARQLRTFDLTTLTSREEQLACWINLYNALIVDAVIRFDLKRSVQDVRGFFWRAAYSIGDLRFNANDIEFGILRANAPHPAIPGPHFAASDPRLRFSLSQRDPRVHFALNCASLSCPPINVYSPDQIDRQLDLAARAFINGGGVKIERAVGEVRLSKIFQWYAPDFGAAWLASGDRRPLLNFAAKYVTDENDRAYLQHGRPKVRFQRYDWSLNRVTP